MNLNKRKILLVKEERIFLTVINVTVSTVLAQGSVHTDALTFKNAYFFMSFRLTSKLITASLNGDWVLETSRSFHYWQPAASPPPLSSPPPRWRPLPWLVNSEKLSMSLHTEGETDILHTELIVEKGKG